MNWLQGIRGNARGCLIYEPMFILPYSLYTTYATVYMLRLGVTTTEIGVIASIGLVLQMFSSAASGYLTDRMGRRRALLTFDLISWTGGTLLWMLSQNIWFFVAAAVVNSYQKIPNTAWYCLLVEDTVPEDRAGVFTALQLITVVGGLFTPLGGWFTARLTVVPATRLMYGLAFVSMTAMFLLRHRAVHETEIGLRKMRETRTARWGEVLRDHLSVIREIASSKYVLAVFSVYILNNFQGSLVTTFLSVYLVSALHIPAAWIALFPAIASFVTLFLIYGVVPKLKPEHALRHVMLGFCLSLVGNMLLIFAPLHQIAFVAVTSVLTASGMVLANPFLEALTANSIRDDERAKFLSVLTVLILLFTWPAGVIGGLTYSADPRATFGLVAGTLIVGLCILALLRARHMRPAG
ncbi:MAG: MFS transporter [Firmicutes bacterium]|nr:MFS transporter [Bacillota bacterium]